MSDWSEKVARAEAAAERLQAAEQTAEKKFDEVHAQAQDSAQRELVLKTPEFNDWMAARHATDAAWGAWAGVMDEKPAG